MSKSEAQPRLTIAHEDMSVPLSQYGRAGASCQSGNRQSFGRRERIGRIGRLSWRGARGCVTGCLKKPFRIAVCVSMAHDLLLMAPLVAAARGRENSDKMPPGLPGGERICRSVKSSPGSNKRLQTLAFCPARSVGAGAEAR